MAITAITIIIATTGITVIVGTMKKITRTAVEITVMEI